jgi:hypothetical protein
VGPELKVNATIQIAKERLAPGRDETHCASFCLVILGLPGDALLLRVAWMAKHDFRTKRTAHFVSLANILL